MNRRYAILEAASALGHVPEHVGVERASGVLLDVGLADGLSARRAGCLPGIGYSGVQDAQTMVIGPGPLHYYSIALAMSWRRLSATASSRSCWVATVLLRRALTAGPMTVRQVDR